MPELTVCRHRLVTWSTHTRTPQDKTLTVSPGNPFYKPLSSGLIAIFIYVTVYILLQTTISSGPILIFIYVIMYILLQSTMSLCLLVQYQYFFCDCTFFYKPSGPVSIFICLTATLIPSHYSDTDTSIFKLNTSNTMTRFRQLKMV